MSEEFKHVGKHVRRERLKYGLSLNDLARETELSPSFLSLLENGKVTPSLKVLDRLARFFSINIAALVAEDDEEDEEQVFVFSRDDQIRVSDRNERTLRFLLPKVGLGIEPVLVTLRPHMTSTPFTQHPGYEFGYVLEGVFEIQVGEKGPVTVQQGDSAIYQSSYPHRLLNPGDRTAKGLWIGLPYTQGIHFAGRQIVLRPAISDPLRPGQAADETAISGDEGNEG